MFNIISIAEERVKKLINTTPIMKISAKLEVIQLAIEELQKKYIRELNQVYKSLLLTKERLKLLEDEKNKLEKNKIKSIDYFKLLKPITRDIKIHTESILKLNQFISSSISKINQEIQLITEEISIILIELSTIDNYYIIPIIQKLKEQNEIIKKTKIKVNYTMQNTLLEINNISKELNIISDLIETILKFEKELEKKDIIQFNK